MSYPVVMHACPLCGTKRPLSTKSVERINRGERPTMCRTCSALNASKSRADFTVANDRTLPLYLSASIAGQVWREDAACQTVDPEIFDVNASHPNEVAAAKRICTPCPVREQCLADALAVSDRSTLVLGGKTGPERITMLNAAKRAKAAKAADDRAGSAA